ncbi:NAD(P)-dependent oxidoreductase [Pseudonocardia sp. CA-107938]|uniref:NAD(P)-dependent oxidoreductase n=1 Tax=Pseudonocardia sp. CA-107938 TaxID=3240021 RepID=UPI003D92FA02
MTDITRVAVFGASGRTGRIVVDELLAAGYEVTAVVRNPGTFATDAQRVVRADVRDETSVREAVAGHDAVVSTIGSGRRPDGLYSASAKSLVSALEDANVKRLVVISSGGAPIDDPGLPVFFRAVIRPLFFGELYADMRAMEEVVRASSLEWTLVRPARLTDTAATGNYRVADGTNPRGGGKLSRADLARFVLTTLEGDSWSRATPTLAQ